MYEIVRIMSMYAYLFSKTAVETHCTTFGVKPKIESNGYVSEGGGGSDGVHKLRNYINVGMAEGNVNQCPSGGGHSE